MSTSASCQDWAEKASSPARPSTNPECKHQHTTAVASVGQAVDTTATTSVTTTSTTTDTTGQPVAPTETESAVPTMPRANPSGNAKPHSRTGCRQLCTRTPQLSATQTSTPGA